MLKIRIASVIWLSLYSLMLCNSAQSAPVESSTLPAGLGRWLAVVGTTGNVLITSVGQNPRQAIRGDRLQNSGDRLSTGQSASATLYFDDGIGVLNLSQLTTLIVVRLVGEASSGKRTRLEVAGGQVKFTIRKFTNSRSRLEIVTPAGTAAVRGTRFGVAVNGSGLTAVATENGQVLASALGQSTLVSGGFQSLIAPGERPSALAIAPEYARLYAMRFESVGTGRIKLSARTDPGNLVQVVDTPVDADLDGRFAVVLDLSPDRSVPVQVTTPLGNTRLFNLTVLPEQIAPAQALSRHGPLPTGAGWTQ